MSSFSSLIWDDFLPPYKKESDVEDDVNSFSSVETLTDIDSREATPLHTDQIENTKKSVSKKFESKFYETNVRKQGDKLLRDMLQLRKDIENFKEQPEEVFFNNETLETNNKTKLHKKSSDFDKSEENILRERLEMMTLQIKQEMEEELLKEKSNLEILQNKPNEDDDTKIKKFLQNCVLQDKEVTVEPKTKEDMNNAIQDLLELNAGPKFVENILGTKIIEPSIVRTSADDSKKEKE